MEEWRSRLPLPPTDGRLATLPEARCFFTLRRGWPILPLATNLLIAMQIRINRGSAAFTLFEIMIVVAIIGLLAAIAVPNYMRARETTLLSSIRNNCRLIDNSKETWALEYTKLSADVPTEQDLAPYIKGGFPASVVGEKYEIGTVGDLTQAVLPEGRTLLDDPGPFTGSKTGDEAAP